MEPTPWYKNTTFWVALFTVVGSLGAMAGVTITPADQAEGVTIVGAGLALVAQATALVKRVLAPKPPSA